LQCSIFLFSLFAFASTAKAYESPLDKLIDLYKSASEKKEKNNNKKENKIENALIPGEKNQSQKSEKNSKQQKRVPQVVTDPKEIEKAAEFAANATGVRKEFIMGMLVVESNLGRNPGECTYQEVADGAQESYENGRLSSTAWQTFQSRQEIIVELADDLGYDYHQLKVSCNPGAAYAGTGGALGVPQFMPDTWLEYKDRIGEIVGKENPDPWDVQDGAVAMALKLSDVWGVTSHSTLAERNAAKIYLSGTTSWQYDWYANKILYWAQNYSQLLG